MRPIVITGGGTGGHVVPMLAIAEALEERGVAREDLRLVGSARGQDRAIVDGAYPLTLLPGRGLRRSLRPGDLAASLGGALGLVGATLRALGLVARWRPSVVVSVGGYASAPASLAALVWRVPLVLVELDAVPGAAQRLVARRATARCRALPGGEGVLTGAPLRRAVAAIERTPAARERARAAQTPPLEARRRVVVAMTGSLGSRRVNGAVVELAGLWSAREDLAIVHVTGRRDAAWVAERRPATAGLDYRTLEFADMAALWPVADVAVCRAGALTVAELTALGVPSVLVPLPASPGDHQRENARRLADAGAALVVEDARCTGEALAAALLALLEPGGLEAAGRAAEALGRRDGAARVADVVLATRAGAP
jgi:UDP-N-acetylglucosamine--N-acetylmuramyl-(pentapeptide) pyrophosphoryl-undecaprenol N-acetylglucosamine transferase